MRDQASYEEIFDVDVSKPPNLVEGCLMATAPSVIEYYARALRAPKKGASGSPSRGQGQGLRGSFKGYLAAVFSR